MKDRMILIEDFPPGLRKMVEAYARQATDAVEEQKEKEKELAVKTTLQLTQEIVYSCAMLSLIEELGFSTDPRPRGEKPPRLQRFVTGIEKQQMYFGHVFGLETLDGLRGRLLSYGVKLEDHNDDKT